MPILISYSPALELHASDLQVFSSKIEAHGARCASLEEFQTALSADIWPEGIHVVAVATKNGFAVDLRLKPPALLNMVRNVDSHSLPYPAHFEAMIADQIANRRVHEVDFSYLKRFAAHELLVIDAGSNIGNSALSCEFAAPGCRIMGFEPNVSLAPFLDRAREICSRYSYYLFGLSDSTGIEILYIPVVNGKHIAGESSMSLDHFSDPIVAARLASYANGQPFSLDASPMLFRRLDDIELVSAACAEARHIVFKIDVEGAEPAVLRGAHNVLRQFRPMLLIENGERPEVDVLLSEMGYSRYIFHEPGVLLPASSGQVALNSFFVHPETAQRYL